MSSGSGDHHHHPSHVTGCQPDQDTGHPRLAKDSPESNNNIDSHRMLPGPAHFRSGQYDVSNMAPGRTVRHTIDAILGHGVSGHLPACSGFLQTSATVTPVLKARDKPDPGSHEVSSSHKTCPTTRDARFPVRRYSGEASSKPGTKSGITSC